MKVERRESASTEASFMDQELYKAAMHGAVDGLNKVVARWEKEHREQMDADPREVALSSASEHVSKMLLCSRTPQGYTALNIAAEQGHTGFAAEALRLSDELLVSANADGNTPLHLAARAGKLEVARLLIDRAKAWSGNAAAQDPGLQPAAAAARPPSQAQAPHLPVARSPSPAQGPMFMKNKEGNTPLHEAVKHRRTAVAVELLDAEPLCAHALNERKESPLHLAAREGLADVVETILRFPWVDVKFVPADSVSGTALHQAVLGGHNRVVEILLGAMSEEQIGLTASDNDNVLHYAAQRNNARVVKLLLEKKPDLAYGRNSSKHQSPLHVAAKYGSAEAMKELLKQRPDAAEMVDSDGKNAFHAAVDGGKVDALRCLLRRVHPDEIVNRVDRDGNTPLHLAAKLCRLRSALMLIKDPRVNPCVLNKDGQSARSLMEAQLQNVPGEDMDAYELYLWKQLKKHEANRCRKHLLPPVATYQSLRGRKSGAGHNQDNFQHSVNTYTLVATLIATVSFAATFTMPGGYSQTLGTAIHGNRAAFKIFVISNTVAMCSSIAVVFCFIWASRDPVKFKLDQLMWGHRLTIVACLAMIVSLMTAVYITVVPTARWPAYVVIAIGASTPAAVILILGKEALYIPL